jgi:hypothetical protein
LGWDQSGYEIYIHLAHQWATDLEVGDSPDIVELALWEEGKKFDEDRERVTSLLRKDLRSALLLT